MSVKPSRAYNRLKTHSSFPTLHTSPLIPPLHPLATPPPRAAMRKGLRRRSRHGSPSRFPLPKFIRRCQLPCLRRYTDSDQGGGGDTQRQCLLLDTPEGAGAAASPGVATTHVGDGGDHHHHHPEASQDSDDDDVSSRDRENLSPTRLSRPSNDHGAAASPTDFSATWRPAFTAVFTPLARGRDDAEALSDVGNALNNRNRQFHIPSFHTRLWKGMFGGHWQGAGASPPTEGETMGESGAQGPPEVEDEGHGPPLGAVAAAAAAAAAADSAPISLDIPALATGPAFWLPNKQSDNPLFQSVKSTDSSSLGFVSDPDAVSPGRRIPDLSSDNDADFRQWDNMPPEDDAMATNIPLDNPDPAPVATRRSPLQTSSVRSHVAQPERGVATPPGDLINLHTAEDAAFGFSTPAIDQSCLNPTSVERLSTQSELRSNNQSDPTADDDDVTSPFHDVSSSTIPNQSDIASAHDATVDPDVTSDAGRQALSEDSHVDCGDVTTGESTSVDTSANNSLYRSTSGDSSSTGSLTQSEFYRQILASLAAHIREEGIGSQRSTASSGASSSASRRTSNNWYFYDRRLAPGQGPNRLTAALAGLRSAVGGGGGGGEAGGGLGGAAGVLNLPSYDESQAAVHLPPPPELDAILASQAADIPSDPPPPYADTPPPPYEPVAPQAADAVSLSTSTQSTDVHDVSSSAGDNDSESDQGHQGERIAGDLDLGSNIIFHRPRHHSAGNLSDIGERRSSRNHARNATRIQQHRATQDPGHLAHFRPSDTSFPLHRDPLISHALPSGHVAALLSGFPRQPAFPDGPEVAVASDAVATPLAVGPPAAAAAVQSRSLANSDSESESGDDEIDEDLFEHGLNSSFSRSRRATSFNLGLGRRPPVRWNRGMELDRWASSQNWLADLGY